MSTGLRVAKPVVGTSPINGHWSLQRKCACGGVGGPSGECDECEKRKMLGMQTRLAISEPGDRYEQEADRVADHVMRMPGQASFAQRMASAPQLSALTRVAGKPASLTEAPPTVHRVLASPGKPLDAATRAFFEPRFGHDFARVRVHTDAAAGQSASAVSASAYTVGSNMVYAPGQYMPGSDSGRRLIAHELAHVVQQREPAQTTVASPKTPANNAGGNADRSDAQPPRAFMGLQRKISVMDPNVTIPDPTGTGLEQTNAQTVEDYLSTLCPTGGASVASGDVRVGADFCDRPWLQGEGWSSRPWPLTESPAASSSTPASCDCLCQLVNSSHQWKVFIDDRLNNPETKPTDSAAGLGESRGCGGCALGPSGTGGSIVIQSPNSALQFGSAKQTAANSPPQNQFLSRDEPWIVFAHELCGHAQRLDQGKEQRSDATRRGLGGHQLAVRIENEIRKEHNLELRASFCGPYCGESFWLAPSRKKGPGWFRNQQPGPDQGKEFKAMCQEHRDRYSRRNGTQYSIENQLPDDCI